MSHDRGPPGTGPAWIARHIGIAWAQRIFDGERSTDERVGFKPSLTSRTTQGSIAAYGT
ncbi:MAG: hypothetical protein HUU26_01025 [Gemmatimonadaceae bacterium]|nr:hypothetical protein [Planctomycetota bacterium]NUQ10897.1 hypothetical protein [Gemmatimonadaceae bacterium]